VKAGVVPLAINGPVADVPTSLSALSADLERALDLLENLGNRLAKDSVVVAVYPTELQSLDIAMQVITAVRAILSGKSGLSIDDARFISLRRSADEGCATLYDDCSTMAARLLVLPSALSAGSGPGR